MINVIEIGGRYGVHRSWQNLGVPIRYHSFEADRDEADRLDSWDEGSHSKVIFRISNTAIHGQNGIFPFYVYDFRPLSSLFELNRKSSYRYNHAKLEKVIDIACITLDSYCETEGIHPDFLSIDAQGASLSILQGGREKIKNCLGMRIELEFFDLYRNAPLADEVLSYLRSQNFRLLRMETPGAGLYGTSTEMNEWSVNPWDGKPASCDAILINQELLDSFLQEMNCDAFSAERIVYLILFCIHNGCGYFGMEVMDLLFRNMKLTNILAVIDEPLYYSLAGQVGEYLKIPRDEVKTEFINNLRSSDFDWESIFDKFFGRVPDSFILDNEVKRKIANAYRQKYQIS